MKIQFNRFYGRALLSLFISLVGWFVVVSSISPDDRRIISNVPVSVELPTGVALSTINLSTERVGVTVEGRRIDIGSLRREDIRVKLLTTDVSRPGKYELPLIVEQPNGSNWRVLSTYPSTISAEFDRIVSKEMYIEKVLGDIEVQGDTHVLGDIRMEPASVTITGPESELSKVHRAVISRTLPDTALTSSVEMTLPITLLDKNDRRVKTADDNGGSLYLSSESCKLSIGILDKKSLPLSVSFINRPNGFPLDRLEYKLTPSEIDVVGKNSVMSQHSSLNVGYIDMSQLDPRKKNVYEFDITVPEGLKKLSDDAKVTFEFSKNNLMEKKLRVSNIELINVPDGYTAKPAVSVFTANIIGSIKDISALSEYSLVAEVDLAGVEPKPGTITLEARVMATNSSLVWALGKYSVTVNITKEKK